jgi:RimJ/RimL family protein N-acetyltransferase
MELLTPRLRLRHWQGSDLAPFAAMNADPVVMEHFPAPLSRAESDQMLERITTHHQTHGFGLWAVEVKATGDFIGFIGLNVPTFEAHFTPTVEIGWRLARPFWGLGYATEGARQALAVGFHRLGLPEIVSFTATINHRSIAVMQRLPMTHDPAENFDHPRVAVGHPLARHVLYRMPRTRYLQISGEGTLAPTRA